MKKLILALFLMSFNLWARPVILVSYYDSFNKAPFNNSEKVAKLLESTLKNAEFDLKLCALNTVFDEAYAQIENCIKSLPVKPLMILGLGEATCDFKIETIMRNEDNTFAPDNAGNERSKAMIIEGAPKAIGLRYPLPQMYCALSKNIRKEIEVSNNAGSFVCNNTAYQLGHYYPEILSGFIHVPSNNCKKIEEKTRESVEILQTMLTTAARYLTSENSTLYTPHTSNDIRLPVLKSELTKLRDRAKGNDCMEEFFKRSKGLDEKRSLWPF